MSRLVRAAPREVKKSKAYLNNPIARERVADLAVIISDIESGRDLTRYLSRDVARHAAGVSGKPLKKRPDLDLMLNDWGVHHLHISTQLEEDGFVKRGGPLLFVVFRPKTAYLIDIMQHRDWTREHVIHVMADEWPDEGIIHEVRGVVGLERKVTEEKHLELRQGAVNVLMEVGGRVFGLSGGMVTTGTTIAATQAADQVLIRLQEFEASLRREPDLLKQAFAREGIKFPEHPNFEFAIFDQGYGVIETVTKTAVPLS